MSERAEFTTNLKAACDAKKAWFNAEELPSLLESYRLLHTCVKNLYDLFVKRAIISPDPYKLERKITDIELPAEDAFADSDASVVVGARFSDYESMLDFICTYFKFSVENFPLSTIKKLSELNGSFQWTNMSTNNSKVNTKGLALLLVEVHRNLPQLSLSMVSDSLSKSSKASVEVTRILKELSDFKREEYKLQIRTQILSSKDFDWQKVTEQTSEVAEIKRLFPSAMGKTPYYSELIQEIAEEDFSIKKAELQARTLALLAVRQVQVKTKKESVDTKLILMETLHTISTLSPEFSAISGKLSDNYRILEGSKANFVRKIIKAIRKAFNMKEPPVIFKVVVEDAAKQTKQVREIDINIFIENLERKANFFSVIDDVSSSEFKRITSSSEDQILQFVNKQISESNETLALLGAVDEYFKTNCASADRPKIKGLKIDLVSVKNILVKSNQRRAEYVSYIDEINQMKKLGITDV